MQKGHADMMTKRILRKELERVSEENYHLRRANRALGEEVNRLNDTIDQAVAIIEERQKARKRMPAWLREVVRDGK
jgi:hypothetical protein